ncbi:dynamin family protein [Pseudonocardia cypriaca]|uniref:Dynamin family protein n=1 Tax=Pseudonocardia cypriaca TaxID=882449 RepID=A0A543FY27_9PSEU|nr:dynamin family protein [Pseudonocardia cypriaca]TQM38748.1 dynamin family protein [Pseudonocardia cypriaca]
MTAAAGGGSPVLRDSVRAVLRRAVETYRDSPDALRWLRHHLDRYDEPLRLAIAGKVKAGKSTLLNALVGEEIAPTDAGECTRVVTWYQDGHAPAVTLYPHSSPPRPLRIARDDGALQIEMGVPADTVDRLEVTWPSASLRATTLIDTPGIASLSLDVSARSERFLAPEDAPSAADAVLYLMRHLHSADMRFLESFHDKGVARAAPVNTIAVLSRADEIGVGRVDALRSARVIAARYRSDETLRAFCQTVVPVAGLLAVTGRTMRQDEFAALTKLAALPPEQLDALLLTVDRFVTSDDGTELPTATRAKLLERFGMFGLRLSTTLIRQGVADSSALAAELVQRSGLVELREVLASQFSQRRDVLKARSALIALDLVLRREPRPTAAPLVVDVERILAGAHEFAELRLLSDLRGRVLRPPKDQAGEAERLIGGDGNAPNQRLGLPPDAARDELRAAALDRLTVWRRRAESPLASRAMANAARVVVRSCEGILAGLDQRL